MLEQRLPEQSRPDIHRLVRNADDVDVPVTDQVEDDMTALGKAAVAGMTSFRSRPAKGFPASQSNRLFIERRQVST